MSAPPPVAMPTAVMTTVPVSRLPKFTALSSSSSAAARHAKPTLTPKNSNNTSTTAANANNANNANAANAANGNAEMGQVSTVTSASSTISHLSGFSQNSPTNSSMKPGTNNVNGRPNGFIRAPTNFTAKWRKENVEDASGDFEYRPGKSAGAKKPAGGLAGKTRLGLNQGAVSSPKAVPKPGNANSYANGNAKAAQQRPTLNCLGRKRNGLSGSDKTRSQSPQDAKKQVAARSHSSDSLGSSQNSKLTPRDKTRSRSLTQVQRQQSPAAPSPGAKSARAYSTNRAERKTPVLPTATGTTMMAMVKKPLAPRQNGAGGFKVRVGVFRETGPIRAHGDKRSQRRNSVETPSSPGSSPEAPDSRGPSSERGSQNEVSLLGETLEDMSLSSTSSLDHHDTSQEYMDDFDNLGNGGVAMLLSSCGRNEDSDSGLDRSRFRDEDDEGPAINGVSTVTELCFLDDGLDWNHIRLATADREHPLRRLSRRRRSSQADFHSQCGSSLDLSPSDSCGSGGTFLWDEEVEPLGGAVHLPIQPQARPEVRTHSGLTNRFHQIQTKPDVDGTSSLCVGSLNSDISSIDALNNLESCDLDEDDLMLDVDFPEDQSLTSDGGSIMAEWRRRQLCWTQDVRSDGVYPEEALSEEQRSRRKISELSLDLCLSSLKNGPGPGADVEELVEDCSSVKAQLEYLQKLLLQEDDADEDTLTTDTLSPETDSSSDGTETQVEVLLQEVLQLRQEVRTRDCTIAQLSLQLSAVVSSRCRCGDVERTEAQTQTTDRPSQTVGSQTSWSSSHTPTILQPDQSAQDPLTDSSSIQPGSPSSSEAPPSPLTDAAGDRSKRSSQPSKLRLFMFSGSSPFKSTSPSQSPAPKHRGLAPCSPLSRGKPGPASSPSLFSRLPKPKTH